MLKRYHIFVSGRVQGVFYRDFSRKCAMLLGIKGWTKNLPDGRVEMMVEGTEHDLREFVAKLRVGPDAAIIDDVESEEEEYKNEFDRFLIM